MSEMMNVRPVTAHDIAAALNLSVNTVRVYLGKSEKKSAACIRVQEYAKKVGYDPKAAYEYNRCNHKESIKHYRDTPVITYYRNGNFKTKKEENQRMEQLRAEGYSNAEIAKKIGRCLATVLNNIGPQDPELTVMNKKLSQTIRKQKAQARKQYVTNKPIREYNKRVEAHNKMKAELNRLQVELLTEKPAIEQAAKVKVDCPALDLHTVQPTALM